MSTIVKLGYNNCMGPAKFVRYKLEIIITGVVYGLFMYLGLKNLFVTTEFHCSLKQLHSKFLYKWTNYNWSKFGIRYVKIICNLGSPYFSKQRNILSKTIFLFLNDIASLHNCKKRLQLKIIKTVLTGWDFVNCILSNWPPLLKTSLLFLG